MKMASAVPVGASRQTDEQGWPLRNLDELYAQAEDVDPVFGAKVAHWASLSYAEPMPAAELKLPWRAMQKVHRVYNGDASRLQDLAARPDLPGHRPDAAVPRGHPPGRGRGGCGGEEPYGAKQPKPSGLPGHLSQAALQGRDAAPCGAAAVASGILARED